ncbi:hypothetical protein FYJ27_04410 [Anaerosalibacter bizertensis]|uniref:Uncharacterized protein n=1 Tax=Anaerosalibacter bizertensis TaxID=932217 RepID=A0A844FG83_9FIRM|nr:hypothetical protein [Anaerosalibacter bizertensis]MBV1818045.1 hypothetical protein [Bacteroidales bacterium MSK.15.36]HHV27262.1 hypothetical protein [Tissierellia bacterium]MBU5293268.1 hypothetical protein [Anaerosalibacter bizertensis]MCB5558792.1 hypothetical protein [Anaerosalibacter bizertensis]MCG4564624.1 hypothetical protein [Anaerosalibacter bizertensis]
MVYTILLLIGILLVIISFTYIMREEKRKDKKYKYIEEMYLDIKKHEEMSIKIMEEFEMLVNSSIDKIENKFENLNDNEQYRTKEEEYLFKEDKYTEENEEIAKIFELKNIGLTNKEIAKKLNRGVREIDIILKMRK